MYTVENAAREEIHSRLEAAERFYSVFDIQGKASSIRGHVVESKSTFISRIEAVLCHRLKSLTADYGLLDRDEVGRKTGISDISHFSSDYHFGSRTLKIMFDAGQEFVLKRGSSFPHRLYDHWLHSNGRDSIRATQLSSGTEQYIYRRFIIPDGDLTNIEFTLYEFGRLLGFAFIFNIVDLHCENIILENGIPKPIDLECCFYPFENLPVSFNLECTGLLEGLHVPDLRRNLSGMFGGGRLWEFADPFVNEGGKIHYKKTKNVAGNTFAQILDARRTAEGLRPFLAGLSDIICHVLRHEKDALDWAREGLRQQNRCLITPTLFYRILISEAAFLGGKCARAFFRRRLHFHRPFSVPSWSLQSEIDQLLVEDIPYFVHQPRLSHKRPFQLIKDKVQWLKENGVKKVDAQAARLFCFQG